MSEQVQHIAQSYMKTVHQMFIRSPCPPTLDRIVKTTVLLLTRNFWNVKDGFKLFREASFVPPPPLIQTVSVCCTGKVDGQGPR